MMNAKRGATSRPISVTNPHVVEEFLHVHDNLKPLRLGYCYRSQLLEYGRLDFLVGWRALSYKRDHCKFTEAIHYGLVQRLIIRG